MSGAALGRLRRAEEHLAGALAELKAASLELPDGLTREAVFLRQCLKAARQDLATLAAELVSVQEAPRTHG